jgi:hypothetical protein
MRTPTKLLQSCLLLGALLLSAAALPAASTFEGRIQMNMIEPRHPDKPLVVNYAVKGNKIRFEMPTDQNAKKKKDGSMAAIFDFDSREMITLIDSGEKDGGRIAMRHKLPEQQAQQAAKGGKAQVPVATGRSEKIAGYSADEYKMTDDNGSVHDLWLAKGLGSFMSPNAQGMGRRGTVSPAWEAFVRDQGFFPMRVVTHDKAGKETSRMEVAKVEKTSLPDSLFSTEGYQEMEIPSFGKGMLNGLMGH